MTQAFEFSSDKIDQMAALLIAHAKLVNETSEVMALDIAASVEAFQEELKDVGTTPTMQKNLTKMLAALQNQDKLRQQMLVVMRGLELVSDARLPASADAKDWYADGIEEIKKRYVMREQVQVHDRFLGEDQSNETDDDEIMFF